MAASGHVRSRVVWLMVRVGAPDCQRGKRGDIDGIAAEYAQPH